MTSGSNSRSFLVFLSLDNVSLSVAECGIWDDDDIRYSCAFFTPLVATPWTLWYSFDEMTMALFTLPPYPQSRLSPYPSCRGWFTFDFSLAVGLNITRVTIGPLGQFGRLSWAFGATDVTTLVTYGGCWRNEESLALVAGASDTLPNGLIDSFVARSGCDSQELFLLLGRLVRLLLLALLGRRPLLGVSWTPLAALMLALDANLVGAVCGSAMVAGAMDAHADGPLDTLHADGMGRCGDPFVRLKRQSILCEQGAGALLLQFAAVELLGDGGRSSRRRSWGRSDGRTGYQLATAEHALLAMAPTQQACFPFPPPWEPGWQA